MNVPFSLIATEDLTCGDFDVSGAFLTADLKEHIYCKPLPGMNVPNEKIILLREALYETKQAARGVYE